VLDTGLGLHLLVRRHARGHQQHAVEPQRHVRLLRAHEVAEVRGVERPAEQADAGHAAAAP
jgi:hypothetical protein